MAQTAADSVSLPTLGLSRDKVDFIIVKAREFDVKVADSDPDSGSNPTDDGDTDILEDKPDDPTRAELAAAIRGLNEEERANLIALAWLGRGTYDLDEWREALDTARAEHSVRAAEYLLGLPMLGDYLEDGLSAFDDDIEDEGGEEAL